MKIIGCQIDIEWENKEANFENVRLLLQQVSPPPDSLIVLPEMFATGFSMNVENIAEGKQQPTQDFLSGIATGYQSFVLGGVVIRGEDGRGLNQAVVYAPSGEELARYSKLHPFSYGEETEHYASGTGIETFDCNSFVVAPFICYDLRFPEAFRAAVRKGAQVLVVIANWPAVREQHWITLLKARAIENQSYVIGINRCGNDPNQPYSGCSHIIGPRGEVLSKAGSSEGWVETYLDLKSLMEYRDEFPALKDMRNDL